MNTEKRDYAISVLKEIDYLTKKEYSFTNDDDHCDKTNESLLKIAQIFNENNFGQYELPLNIFKI